MNSFDNAIDEELKHLSVEEREKIKFDVKLDILSDIVYHKEHYERMLNITLSISEDFLKKANALFLGGTAIGFLTGGCRHSTDLDFILPVENTIDKLKNLGREAKSERFLNDIFLKPDSPYQIVDFIEGENKIMLYIKEKNGNNKPVKLELFEAEFANIPQTQKEIIQQRFSVLGVDQISIPNFFAHKLIANHSRYLNESSCMRDFIDLALLIKHRGHIPPVSIDALDGMKKGYKDSCLESFFKAYQKFNHNHSVSKGYLKKLGIQMDIQEILDVVRAEIEHIEKNQTLNDLLNKEIKRLKNNQDSEVDREFDFLIVRGI